MRSSGHQTAQTTKRPGVVVQREDDVGIRSDALETIETGLSDPLASMQLFDPLLTPPPPLSPPIQKKKAPTARGSEGFETGVGTDQGPSEIGLELEPEHDSSPDIPASLAPIAGRGRPKPSGGRSGSPWPIQGYELHAPLSDSFAGIAQAGIRGSGTMLPFLPVIQASFGSFDVSGIKAHQDGPAQDATRSMKARAYATGSDVAFAGPPDLHTAAHEAAHVVQQRSGLSLPDGVGRAGDEYEKHADQVADRVVGGGNAEPMLQRFAPSVLPTTTDPTVSSGPVQLQDEDDEPFESIYDEMNLQSLVLGYVTERVLTNAMETIGMEVSSVMAGGSLTKGELRIWWVDLKDVEQTLPGPTSLTIKRPHINEFLFKFSLPQGKLGTLWTVTKGIFKYLKTRVTGGSMFDEFASIVDNPKVEISSLGIDQLKLQYKPKTKQALKSVTIVGDFEVAGIKAFATNLVTSSTRLGAELLRVLDGKIGWHEAVREFLGPLKAGLSAKSAKLNLLSGTAIEMEIGGKPVTLDLSLDKPLENPLIKDQEEVDEGKKDEGKKDQGEEEVKKDPLLKRLLTGAFNKWLLPKAMSGLGLKLKNEPGVKLTHGEIHMEALDFLDLNFKGTAFWLSFEDAGITGFKTKGVKSKLANLWTALKGIPDMYRYVMAKQNLDTLFSDLSGKVTMNIDRLWVKKLAVAYEPQTPTFRSLTLWSDFSADNVSAMQENLVKNTLKSSLTFISWLRKKQPFSEVMRRFKTDFKASLKAGKVDLKLLRGSHIDMDIGGKPFKYALKLDTSITKVEGAYTNEGGKSDLLAGFDKYEATDLAVTNLLDYSQLLMQRLTVGKSSYTSSKAQFEFKFGKVDLKDLGGKFHTKEGTSTESLKSASLEPSDLVVEFTQPPPGKLSSVKGKVGKGKLEDLDISHVKGNKVLMKFLAGELALRGSKLDYSGGELKLLRIGGLTGKRLDVKSEVAALNTFIDTFETGDSTVTYNGGRLVVKLGGVKTLKGKVSQGTHESSVTKGKFDLSSEYSKMECMFDADSRELVAVKGTLGDATIHHLEMSHLQGRTGLVTTVIEELKQHSIKAVYHDGKVVLKEIGELSVKSFTAKSDKLQLDLFVTNFKLGKSVVEYGDNVLILKLGGVQNLEGRAEHKSKELGTNKARVNLATGYSELKFTFDDDGFLLTMEGTLGDTTVRSLKLSHLDPKMGMAKLMVWGLKQRGMTVVHDKGKFQAIDIGGLDAQILRAQHEKGDSKFETAVLDLTLGKSKLIPSSGKIQLIMGDLDLPDIALSHQMKQDDGSVTTSSAKLGYKGGITDLSVEFDAEKGELIKVEAKVGSGKAKKIDLSHYGKDSLVVKTIVGSLAHKGIEAKWKDGKIKIDLEPVKMKGIEATLEKGEELDETNESYQVNAGIRKLHQSVTKGSGVKGGQDVFVEGKMGKTTAHDLEFAAEMLSEGKKRSVSGGVEKARIHKSKASATVKDYSKLELDDVSPGNIDVTNVDVKLSDRDEIENQVLEIERLSSQLNDQGTGNIVVTLKPNVVNLKKILPKHALSKSVIESGIDSTKLGKLKSPLKGLLKFGAKHVSKLDPLKLAKKTGKGLTKAVVDRPYQITVPVQGGAVNLKQVQFDKKILQGLGGLAALLKMSVRVTDNIDGNTSNRGPAQLKLAGPKSFKLIKDTAKKITGHALGGTSSKLMGVIDWALDNAKNTYSLNDLKITAKQQQDKPVLVSKQTLREQNVKKPLGIVNVKHLLEHTVQNIVDEHVNLQSQVGDGEVVPDPKC